MKPTLRIFAVILLMIAAPAANASRADDRCRPDGDSSPSQSSDGATNGGTPAWQTAQAGQAEGTTQDASSRAEKKKPSLVQRWLGLADRVQSEQPDWLSALATTSGRLKQEFRYDVFDQPAAGGNIQYQLGGSKGLEFITSSRTQLLVGVPTYTLESPNGPRAGFGDLPLQLKFRIASAERSEGNYLLTFFLSATAPTGAHRYASGDGVLTPSLAAGKGWGRFDVQSTIGENLPTGHTTRLGRQIQWNTALQYHARWNLWPELEANSMFYQTGRNAGAKQLFLTPGLGFGRVHLNRRFRFSSAAGMQIAATRFHSYNHRWIFSERLSF